MIPEMPSEFKLIARNVSSSAFESIKSVDDVATHALNGIGPVEASVVKPFIRSLLDQNPTAAMLADFWSSTPSGMFFSDGETVRKILEALYARLLSEPYLTGKPPKNL